MTPSPTPPPIPIKEEEPAPMGWRGLSSNESKRRRDMSRERQRDTLLARQRIVRASTVMGFMIILAMILSYRLVYWQILMRTELLPKASRVSQESSHLPFRGTIRDRNGYLLATDEVFYKFWVSPNVIHQPDPLAKDVSEITSIPFETLRDMFSGEEVNLLADPALPYKIGQKMIELDKLPFILEPFTHRSYPNGMLACHLLGFVNAEPRGSAGIEMYYDELLSGKQKQPNLEGQIAEEIKLGQRPFTPTQNGVDLVLTIDRAIQFMIEQELTYAVETYDAEGGTIIVMEPESGEVLGMASYPCYDPNHYEQYLEDGTIFQDPAISRQYEPGSIFKLITIAAALDQKLVLPNSVWNDPGELNVGGQIIKNWDHNAYGPRTVTEILGYSLNTGTAWLSVTLGEDMFYHYVERFGFGAPTGIELSNEMAGTVKIPGEQNWHPSDLGTNSFGQGIAVTPIQMVSAVASLLNNGQLMQAKIVEAVISHAHLQEMPPSSQPRQSVSPQVAQTMRQMMVDAVRITTHDALLEDEGWLVGGKTGTAQIPIEGGYHPEDTIASFIGFAPADEPAFVVLVKLDRPQGEYQWGSRSAAPTFKRITHHLLNYYNIPPDEHRAAYTSDMPTAVPMDVMPSQLGVHATPTP